MTPFAPPYTAIVDHRAILHTIKIFIDSFTTKNVSCMKEMHDECFYFLERKFFYISQKHWLYVMSQLRDFSFFFLAHSVMNQFW